MSRESDLRSSMMLWSWPHLTALVTSAILLYGLIVASAHAERRCPPNTDNYNKCSQFIEKELIQKYPTLFKRNGVNLSVKLRNGRVKTYKDFPDGEGVNGDDVNHFYVTHHFPEVHYAVIDIGHYEGGPIFLLNLRDGKQTYTGGYAVLSPDKRRFAIAHSGSAYDPAVLAVYRIASGTLSKEYEERHNEFGFGRIRWTDPSSLAFVRLLGDAAKMDELPGKLRVVQGDAKNAVSWIRE